DEKDEKDEKIDMLIKKINDLEKAIRKLENKK
ncbi:TPA: ion transporter, partial [Enterococcus faecalis]|nr:ion transporter [Enterococcus faecalis]HAP4126324.1 ion transporter [Enterococcus faecalis]